MNYEIKISGSGTAKQIASALRDIARSIQEASDGNHETAELDGASWEDPTLMTKIQAQ